MTYDDTVVLNCMIYNVMGGQWYRMMDDVTQGWWCHMMYDVIRWGVALNDEWASYGPVQTFQYQCM